MPLCVHVVERTDRQRASLSLNGGAEHPDTQAWHGGEAAYRPRPSL